MAAPDVRVRDAATVALLRDGSNGPEVLLVQRAAALRTHGGAWAFPGGAVDPDDHVRAGGPRGAGEDPSSVLGAARHAACRETQEEIGVDLDPDALVPLSHWTTPHGAPTIYRTWFFVAVFPGAEPIRPDPAEVAATRWVEPTGARSSRDAGDLDLPVPQFVTLHQLDGRPSVAAVLADVARRPPEVFHGRATEVADGLVWRYHGDEAWDHGDLDRAGLRHRMWMVSGAWRYERDDARDP